MHARSQVEGLRERLTDLSDRLAKADDFFAHHQGIANEGKCPVSECAPCKRNAPLLTENDAMFRTAVDRVGTISRELGEITGIAWSLGYQWDGLRLVPYGDERPDPPLSPFPTEPLAFTGTQVQDLSDLE